MAIRANTLVLDGHIPFNTTVNIYRGATFHPKVTWTSNGVPIDWSSYTGEMIINFDGHSDTDIILSSDNGNWILHNDGVWDLFIDDDITATIQANGGTVRAYLTDANGFKDLWLRGKVIIS